MTGIAVGEIQNLYAEWKSLAKEGFALEDLTKMVTSNPARRAGLFREKGSLDRGRTQTFSSSTATSPSNR